MVSSKPLNKPVSPLRQAFRDSRSRQDAKRDQNARIDGGEKWLPADEWWHLEVNRMMDDLASQQSRLIPKSVQKFRDSGLQAIRESTYYVPEELL